MFTTTIGQRIRQIRLELNLTQSELAKDIGVKPITISHYEVGTRKVSEQSMQGICRTHNVSYEFLKNGTLPMFIDNPYQKLSTLIEQQSQPLDDADVKLITAYLNLSTDKRKIIREFLQSCFQ